MQHVLILGAGFGGLELAARLSASLGDEVHITLVDQHDSFIFGFSKLEILFGRQTREQVCCPYRDISRPGVEFRQERVTSIDPQTRHVVTDGGTYEPDILVVALGADYDPAATPGFVEDGYEYYSVAGAERLREVLASFSGGDVLIAILGVPFKCPPAPYEGALLLHDYLVGRGRRDATHIQVISPMDSPIPVSRETSAAIVRPPDAWIASPT
jgi:sulfide:quinone oxidoreductase